MIARRDTPILSDPLTPPYPSPTLQVDQADTSAVRQQLRAHAPFAVALLRVMPWAIGYHARMKLFREVSYTCIPRPRFRSLSCFGVFAVAVQTSHSFSHPPPYHILLPHPPPPVALDIMGCHYTLAIISPAGGSLSRPYLGPYLRPLSNSYLSNPYHRLRIGGGRGAVVHPIPI